MPTTNRQRTESSKLAGASLTAAPNKTTAETKHLTELLTWLGWTDTAIAKSERPDFHFMLDRNGQKVAVGCELTRLYIKDNADDERGGSPEARFWSQWKAFAIELQSNLKNQKPPLGNIYGAIHFSQPDYAIFDRIERSTLIREIVTLLQNSPPIETLVNFSADKYPILANHVHRIWTTEVADRPLLWWAAHLRSGILRDPSETIVRVIGEKAIKAKDYCWGDSALRWLVIVAPGEGLSDNVALSPAASYSLPDSATPFSHILLFARGIGDWYVQQIHPSNATLGRHSRPLALTQ